jgi:hypothetical protein
MSDKELPIVLYTDLEKKEITILMHKIKKEHKPTIKQLQPIADDMIEIIQHDKELVSVYNKKTTIIGSLYKLFLTNNMTTKYKKEIYDKIHEYEGYIEQRLREEEQKKRKEESRCSRSFSACTIL